MFKKLIIIVLVLLIIGLYFFPGPTKDVVSATGKATMDFGKQLFGIVKDSDIVANMTDGNDSGSKEATE
jgi:hypothetical protein